MSPPTDKIILITGASGGIGEATARRLALDGATVILGARRTERVARIADELISAGGTAAFRTLDVTRDDDFQAFVDFAHARYGRVDALISAAGVISLSLMTQRRTGEWNRMIDVNIRGVLNGIAAVLPIFEAQGSGHFINLASVGAPYVGPASAVYCATKYAVRAISEGLRQENQSVRMTTICADGVDTKPGHDVPGSAAQTQLTDLRKTALTPDAMARAIRLALTQPEGVDINEMILRPNSSAGGPTHLQK